MGDWGDQHRFFSFERMEYATCGRIPCLGYMGFWLLIGPLNEVIPGSVRGAAARLRLLEGREAVKMTCSARWDDGSIWFATVFDPTADDVKTLWRLVGSYILLFSNMNVMRNQHLS